MTVYISGGSNSLMASGWVSHLQDRIGDTDIVENVSIGAAPSQMGAFRCHQISNLGADDTVIWEYGVNDANHIDTRGYKPREVLKALEWVILLCRDRGAKFAAMIFQPNRRESKKKVTRYRRKIHNLCERYGVGYFDVSAEYRARTPGADRIPRKYFKDNSHYKTDTDLMGFIADGAVELLKSARVPSGEPNDDIGRLAIYTDFNGGAPDYFENRMISVRTWRPGEQALSCRLGAAGRIVGLVMTSTPKGGAFDFELGDRQLRISATYREKSFNKTMIKFVSLPVLAGDKLEFEAGESVSIDWAATASDMLADFRFRKAVGKDTIAAREAGIVALMVEKF